MRHAKTLKGLADSLGRTEKTLRRWANDGAPCGAPDRTAQGYDVQAVVKWAMAKGTILTVQDDASAQVDVDDAIAADREYRIARAAREKQAVRKESAAADFREAAFQPNITL